jgi:glycosyltransferase involved in cell wall biosynthesis
MPSRHWVVSATPKVSVLIPVYNGGKYLAECIESVLAQDFTDYEVLIADDHSTDDSLELAQQYAAKDNRVRSWKNPRNLGLVANFNCCLREARGEYIKYISQDDKLLSPETLRLMAKTLDDDDTISMVGSASYVLDDQSRKLELRRYFKDGVMDGKIALLRCLERSANLIGEPSVTMYRRRQTERGMDERYRQLVDLELWTHLLEQGQFAYLSEPLCAFRRHALQQSAVNKSQTVVEEEMLMLLEHCFARPWFQKMAAKKVLFPHVYFLNRHPIARFERLHLEMKKTLGKGWYFIYWMQRKLLRPLTRPFTKLQRRLAT